MSIFGIRLKELRNKSNLSQQELSNIIGISKSSINMYERGEREPGLETVGTLADYFNVQTDYLLGKTNDTMRVGDSQLNLQMFAEKNPPPEASLTEGEKALLELFRRVPEEHQRMLLDMIRVALGNQQP